MTREGHKCRPWDTEEKYKKLGSSNYCRHPDPTNEKLINDGPWCFVESKHTKWAYCDIRHCNDCDVLSKNQLTGISVGSQ